MTRLSIQSCVFLLVLAAAFSVASAETARVNEIGLYTNSDGTGATGTSVIGESVELFLVLTRPTDVVNGNVACTTYFGFDLLMSFDPLPAGNLALLDIDLPGDHLDIGIKNFGAGFLGFACGISYKKPLPVQDEAVVIATLTFKILGTQVTEVFLGPHPGGYPRPTEMRFLGGNASTALGMAELLTMRSAHGGHDSPVFRFNGTADAGFDGPVGRVESASFGSVKALFR